MGEIRFFTVVEGFDRWVIVHGDGLLRFKFLKRHTLLLSPHIANQVISLTPSLLFFLTAPTPHRFFLRFSIPLDSPSPTFHLGFPPQIADFLLRQFRPLPPLFKCAAPVDPWRDSLHFEFPSPKKQIQVLLPTFSPLFFFLLLLLLPLLKSSRQFHFLIFRIFSSSVTFAF